MKPLILIFISVLMCLTVSAQSVELVFAGDAMLHTKQQEIALKNNRWDFSECFTAIRPQIEKADLSIVNLELPLGGPPYSGYPTFCGPDAYAEALKACGFDIFLCANNHILDSRTRGARRTIQTLDSMKVYPMGIYRSRGEASERHPLMIERNHIRMAFLNYTYGTNGFKPEKDFIVNYIDTVQMRKDIAMARRKHADIIIATLHWGNEYVFHPSSAQKQIARFLQREGVNVIIGSHPHVVQPFELKRNTKGEKTLLVYSLGNFISNMSAPHTTGGAIVRVRLTKKQHITSIDTASYRLHYTQRYTNDWHPTSRVIDATAWSEADTTWSKANQSRIKDYLDKTRNLFKFSNIGIHEENK